jgi:hypothetical protein
VLLLASQYSFQYFRRVREEDDERKGWHQEWVSDTEAWPPYDADFPDIEEIRKQSGIDQNMEMTETLFDTEEEFFAHGKEVAQELDQQEEDLKPFDFSKHPYLNKPWVWFTRTSDEGLVPKQEQDPLDIPVLENEETWSQRVIDENQSSNFDAEEYYEYLDGQPELEESELIEAAEPNEKAAMHRWKEEHPDSSLKLQRKLFDKGVIEELPWHQYLQPRPDFTEEDESKKKDINLDGDSGRTSGQKEQRIVADTYIQNAEQGNETLWQRIKKGNE